MLPGGVNLAGEQAGLANILEFQVMRDSMQAEVQGSCARAPVRARPTGFSDDPINSAELVVQGLTDDDMYKHRHAIARIQKAIRDSFDRMKEAPT